MMDRSKSLLFASVAALLFMMPQTVYGKDSDALESSFSRCCPH